VLSYDKVQDVFRWKQGIRSVFRRVKITGGTGGCRSLKLPNTKAQPRFGEGEAKAGLYSMKEK
jgi:hypothetical protein